MAAAGFLFFGLAIAYVIGGAAVLAFIATDNTRYLAILPQRIFSKIDVFALMAMPLFILAGELMNRGGITGALINLSMALVGGLRGGLGHVNILTSVLFAGISGSAVADAAALSNTLMPEMQRRGYTLTHASAITAASSIIGSIDKLIYGLRLPYYFADMAEVDRALTEGGRLARINAATTPEGVRIVSVNTVGQASGIFNTKKPVESVADMAGLRMRALDESQIELYEAWGAAGTIVSWAEVPNALQTGVADGYLNPAFVPLLFGHSDFIKYFTDAAISPSLRITIVSEDWYQGLSDADRATVDAAAAAATAANRDRLKTQDAVLGKLEAAGVAIERLDQATRAEFRAATAPAYDTGLLSPEQIAAWDAAKGN